MKVVAKDHFDLKKQLCASHASVRDRGKGRNKVQTEGWVSRQLLPTLSNFPYFHFPVTVEFKDRPDLRLYMPEDSIGIEITEVVPEIYAQADAIRNRNYPNATVDRSIFTWGAKYTSKQIHDHLSTVGGKLTGPGWTRDAVEQEWADAVSNSIKVKQRKLNTEGYSLFPKNWLAAYTSVPGPSLKINQAAFLIKLPKQRKNQHVFDIIFVLTDYKIVILNNVGREVRDLVK